MTTVEEWLVALGMLTASKGDDAEAKLAAYIPLLAARFEAAAFTQASLEAVAARCKFFPSYSEIVEHLGAWWRDNRPRPQGLAPPKPQQRPQPSPEQIAAAHAQVEELLASFPSRRARASPQPRYLTPAQLARAYAQDRCTPPVNYAEIANG